LRNRGITFEAEKTPEITRASRVIGTIFEIAVIAGASFIIGVFVAPLFAGFWPTKTVASVSTATAVIAAILAFLSSHLVDKLKSAIGDQLKIRVRVAPYFGHRITRAVQIIRS
jgi:hypothetical protein